MDPNVQDLYRKICSGYERIILSDHKLGDLQDTEYSLWKLHYRHIDEYRKRMKRNSANGETTTFATPQSVVAAKESSDNHVVGFKSFLSKATEFYQNLIFKIKRYYVLPEDFSFLRSGGNSASVEPKKMQKLQFLCHRFLVCLGDFARYREQCEKSDAQSHNWSVAVAHYLEATIIWPDSGNPQNQVYSCYFLVMISVGNLENVLRLENSWLLELFMLIKATVLVSIYMHITDYVHF